MPENGIRCVRERDSRGKTQVPGRGNPGTCVMEKGQAAAAGLTFLGRANIRAKARTKPPATHQRPWLNAELKAAARLGSVGATLPTAPKKATDTRPRPKA